MKKIFYLFSVIILGISTLNGCALLFHSMNQSAQDESSAQASKVWIKKDVKTTTDLIISSLKPDPSIKEIKVENGKIIGKTDNGVNFNITFSEKGEYTGAILRVEKGLFSDSGTETMEYALRTWLINFSKNYQ